MNYSIYRENQLIAETLISGNWRSKVMGEDIAQASWTMSSMTEFQKGDYILKNGLKYILSGKPSVTQSSSFKYDYTGNFEAEASYSLIDTQYFMYDQDNQPTLSEFSLTGKPSVFLNLLIRNANRGSSGWVVGIVDDEREALTLTFSDEDNCRTVLTKLAEACKTEFWFDGKTIHLTKKGNATGISFAYGQGNGLYEVKGITSDDFQLITKLYYFGGSNNLPVGYRKNSAGVASRKLLGASRFIQADAETIKAAGIIERSKTFADIFPKREGTVTGIFKDDKNVIADTTLDFDINEQLQPGVTAKISFTTGSLAGYQFEINNYKSSLKAIEFNTSKDELAFGTEGLPNQYLRPAIGDKYVLLDLQMPLKYVTEAELKLDAAALDFLNKSKQKPIKCEVVCSPIFIEQNNLYGLNIGDYVAISSPVLSGSFNIRIIGVTVDMQDPSKITLELADEVTVSAIIKNILEKDNIVNIINLNKLYDVNRARRNVKTVSELQNYIVDPEGNYYTGKIRAGSLETLYFSNGAKATNFSLKSTAFTANAGGDPAVFDVTAGQLVHFAIEIPGVGFVWNMEARRFTNLDPAKTYYVYARVSRTSLTGTWVISEDIITAEQEAGYFNLQSGVLFLVVDGRRDHEFTKGMVFMVGDQIKAGILMDLSGQNFFNMTDGTFNLGAANAGIDYGVSIPDTLSVQQMVIGYGDYVSVIGNEGLWPLAIGAPSFDRPQEAKFRVSRDGTMYAKQAVIEGTITAGAGSKIGDIIIDAAGKFYIDGTKVEIKPDVSIRVFNGGVADFSKASKLIVPSADGKLWKISVTTSASGGGAVAPGGGATTLAGLVDVSLDSTQDSQALVYHSASGKWVNKTIVTDLSNYATYQHLLNNYWTAAYINDNFILKTGANAVAGSYWDIKTQSAVFWGGHAADFTQSVPASRITAMAAFNTYTGRFEVADLTQTRDWLQLKSAAYNNTTDFVLRAVQMLGNGSVDDITAQTGVYRNENGAGGNLNYSPLLNLNAADTGLQISGGYNREILRFRGWYPNGSGIAFTPWRDVWHTGSFNPLDYVDKVSAQSIAGVKTFENGAVFNTKLVIPSNDAKSWKIYVTSSAPGGGAVAPGGGSSSLAGLVDVALYGAQDNQALVYDSATGKWVNKTVVTDLSNYYSRSSADARFLGISGTAANSNTWNGQTYTGVELNGDFTYFMAFDGAGWKPTTVGAVQRRLGLGTAAGYDINLIHKYGTFTADANTIAEHTSSFTYGLNAPFVGPLVHHGAQGYGLQLNAGYGSGSNAIGFRTRNGDGSEWNPWHTIFHSGNVTFSQNADASTAAFRNAAGQLFATYFNTTASAESSTMGTVMGQNTSDGYLRPFTAEAVANFLEGSSRHWRLTNNTEATAFNAGTLELRNSHSRPSLGLHWGGVVASTISIDSDGAVLIMNNPGTAYENLRVHNLYAQNDVTAIYGYFSTFMSAGRVNAGYDSGVTSSVNAQYFFAKQSIQTDGHLLSGTGTDGGYSNQSYNQGHNNIWRLNNAKDFGIAYYQAMPQDAIGFHFGDRGDAIHAFHQNGNYRTRGRIETAVDGVGSDPYGIISVTRGQASNFSYYGMTRAGSIGWSMGIDTEARAIWGLGATGAGVISDIKMRLSQAGDLAISGAVNANRGIFGYDSGVTGSVNSSGWFRSVGDTGWYNATYNGGLWMNDNYWIRTYGDKGFFVQGGSLQVTYEASAAGVTSRSNGFKSNTELGLTGDYEINGGTDKIIWTIGANWNSIETMYGLGYRLSGNHQIVIRQAGVVGISLGMDGTSAFSKSVVAPVIQATSALYIPSTSGKQWKIYVKD